jgi:hypothetical protein
MNLETKGIRLAEKVGDNEVLFVFFREDFMVQYYILHD